ncbi:MAG: hypothetical protein H8E26_03330 [FCB group bacterium]|nr:hypothetical protein [FCB group bacterium]MBL7026959.1 hypothetical protein [Candidatus Neomarinimicrobiota bacterium]MBL7122139.1 hypothetical protein [Candidatus Neomarinimicrobiota bacterium]
MSLLDLFGFSGMILLLAAFLLNQINYFANDSVAYHVFNLLGAYILTYYAIVLGNTPFIILEFVWGSFSLYQLTINRTRNTKTT